MINSRQFKELYATYLDSGLSVRGFCSNHQIAESKFYYWQNKLRKELASPKGFVPLVIGCEHKELPPQVAITSGDYDKHILKQPNTDQILSCEITYPNGVSLKLNGLTDAGLLRSLLLL